MNNTTASYGYTLPVFACASAIAALFRLQKRKINEKVYLDLVEPSEIVTISINQIAKIQQNQSLAITISNPGDNLDLTRNTPIWVIVELKKYKDNQEQVTIQGGEGVGKQVHNNFKDAIYSYAEKLLRYNLQFYLTSTEKIIVTIILPEGKKLSRQTSNEAFGIIKGLSLLGTSGISRPLSTASQLQNCQEELQKKSRKTDTLVFCLGENGLSLAKSMGINSHNLIKTANWIGPLLIMAGIEKVTSIILFGYHGKLIKLAGGIFNTHHHLADGRLEVLITHGVKVGLPSKNLQTLFKCQTAEDALAFLRSLDEETKSQWSAKIYQSIAETIDKKAQSYIHKYVSFNVAVGSILFKRNRSIVVFSKTGKSLFNKLIKI
ncbi:cobalt-precorrin-5B (C(1))-methyltransferase CbiD [Candidatus Atelocyanobacterium thalassae]|uniref:Cobalt-precorrin-5B C(1)-methyltransferase n=1 Tax=cyanobacterium endosymbiont of Braarudosphaera bigelowii TaxID=1285375 RepID=A0ABM7U5F9_9CHRO|nr:cobalt-precorrin-5B (C(1))-methyltransferase CbiD [Candidatus Atelocyanobacterium thalassa]BDA39602.1 cobalt-precorrin-5B C(1)-methyltransferase [cyanobacterium endosymbiont of Braarudosphaera bigelowii]